MAYRILLQQYHATADSARRQFAIQLGVAEGKFQVEQPIHRDIRFIPTFNVMSRERYLIVIEVAEQIERGVLSDAILVMKNQGLPAKVYVAIPEGAQTATFKEDLRFARQNGLGLVEMRDPFESYQEPLLLNLTGVRKPDALKFSKALRAAIVDSLRTFENGNPRKACTVVTDEIEGMSRRLAAHALRVGALGSPPAKVTVKMPWAGVMDALLKHHDRSKGPFTKIDKSLLARVSGLTTHRNEGSHPPRSAAERRRIDAQLKTRYEHACDVLSDLSQSCPRDCLPTA